MRNGRVDKYLFEGGYAQASVATSTTDNFAFFYYNRDHLGSIREVVDASGKVKQVTNYYPFGAPYADTSSSTNPDFQPYKYNGKELDRMHGLDTYDYGARQHDPILCRWDRMDPLCEKYYGTSPYVYCKDNPVKFVDIDGYAPGDFFKTKDDAAKDFGLFYNGQSIRERREYGSTIYIIKNNNGITGYTYSVANRGKEDHVVVSEAPFGAKKVATIHTHGAYSEEKYVDNEFSGIRDKRGELLSKDDRKKQSGDNDIGNANKRGLDSYLVTPNGSLQKYDPKTNEISVISNEMPSDSNDPSILNQNTEYLNKDRNSSEEILEKLRKELMN